MLDQQRSHSPDLDFHFPHPRLPSASMRIRSSLAFVIVLLLALPALAQQGGKVTIYSSIDDPYVRPLVQRFQQKTGIQVNLVTDSEATKTAGLVEKLEAEKSNPQADVYWGNEIFHTINLAHQGVFAPYRSPVAKDIPDRWKDKDGLYTDIGMRARFLAFSTRPEYKALVPKIKGIADLANPALKGKVGVCHPGFGTASGQFAALYVILGEEKYKSLLQSLKANDTILLGGNSAVADQVAAGTLIAGLTDNDDLSNGKADGQQIDGIAPDQDSFGTLLIPTTIALVKNSPNPDNARKLIDFLLDPSVEKELIEGRFLAYSTRSAAQQVKAMDVEYAKLAQEMRHAIELALTILQDRK
jgi:iron(III) transport system substrate-binding protein